MIHKRLGSDERQIRQFQAMRGPLKRFWVKKGKKLQPRPGMLKMLHRAKRARARS